MSLEAGITVRLKEFQSADVVECYIKKGLGVFDPRGRAHIITSDDELYDWNYEQMTYTQLKDIINYRQQHNFPIGISLFENNILITNLLIQPPDRITFNCDINRKTVGSGNTVFTDVNWYIEKLVVPLIEAGLGVTFLEYWETR